MEIEETIRLLQAYMNGKNNGDYKDIWLKKIEFNDNEPTLQLISDNNKRYQSHANSKLLHEINEDIEY